MDNVIAWIIGIVILGLIVMGVISFERFAAAREQPALAWEIYMEAVEYADREYARAYGLEDKEGL